MACQSSWDMKRWCTCLLADGDNVFWASWCTTSWSPSGSERSEAGVDPGADPGAGVWSRIWGKKGRPALHIENSFSKIFSNINNFTVNFNDFLQMGGGGAIFEIDREIFKIGKNLWSEFYVKRLSPDPGSATERGCVVLSGKRRSALLLLVLIDAERRRHIAGLFLIVCRARGTPCPWVRGVRRVYWRSVLILTRQRVHMGGALQVS
jgi:hypothetical protein